MTDSISVQAEPNAQSWTLLTFLFALATFLEVAVLAHFVLFTPAFLNEIGFSQTEINVWTGPIASAGFVLGIWFVPFWGTLADRHGRKPLILRSYYVEIVAMGIAAVSQNVWLFLVSRALTGFALGNTGLMYASLTEAAPRRRVALALGLVNGSGPLGSLVGALAGGWIVSQFGVHWLFGIDAIVAALIAVILTAAYHEPFVAKSTAPMLGMLESALRTVVESPVAVTIFVLSFVYNAAYFFSYTYLPVRIGEVVGDKAAPNAIGITQGIAGVTTLVGSGVLGGLADRVGHRRMLGALMLCIVILWLPLYAATTLGSIALFWAVFSAISPSVSSLMFAILSLNVPPDKRGTIFSMIYLPMNVAFVVAPFSASLVASNFQVRDVFLVSGAISLFALLIFVVNIGRTQEKRNILA